MDIGYGHMVNTDHDEYIELGEKGNHAFADVGRYRNFLMPIAGTLMLMVFCFVEQRRKYAC